MSDIQGGFVNRFCFFVNEDTGARAIPLKVDIDNLRNLSQFIYEKIQRYEHQEFRFDPTAEALVISWYTKNRKQLAAMDSEIKRVALQRLDLHTRKLALVYAAMENEPGDNLIHEDQFMAAMFVADYWRRATSTVFSKFSVDDYAKNEKRLIEEVERVDNGKALTRREIQRKTSGTMSVKQFNVAFDALEHAGVLIITKDGKRKLVRLSKG